MNHGFRFRFCSVLATLTVFTIAGVGCQHENALGIDDHHALVVMSVSMENLIVPEQHPIPQSIIIGDANGQTASLVLNPDWPVTTGTENLMGFLFAPVVSLFDSDQGSPRNLIGVRLPTGTYEVAALRGVASENLVVDGLFQMPVGSTFTVEKGNRAYYLGHLNTRLHLRDAETQSSAAIAFPRVDDLAGFNEGSFDIEVQDWYSADFNRLAVSYPAINQVPHEHELLELPAEAPQTNFDVHPFPIDGYIGPRSDSTFTDPDPAMAP